MKNFVLLFCVLATTFLFAVNNPMTWQNEIYDCGAMKYNGEYFFSGNFLDGDMLVSRDLRNWGWRTHVFSYNNSWHSGTDRDIHGSHMRYENGIFHYYAHLGTVDGITHATNPISVLGPYSEPVTSHEFTKNIDADTFKDDDGAFYFYATKFISGESIYSYPMSDLYTLGASTQRISPSSGDGSNINEASKVFKYRDKYYMLYNTYDTVNYDYRVRGVEATTPTGFSNSGKYTDPIIVRTPLDATREIVRIGQPWMVEGPNGFERWVGYFAHVATSGTITEQGQYIDRLFFLGDDMKADAPTHRDMSGYHPPPAQPEYLGLFNGPNGGLPSELTYGAGTWNVVDKELRQTDSSSFRNVIINTNQADNFLVEANIKFLNGSSTKAGIVLFKDGNDWIRVGLDENANRWFYERNNDGSYATANYALPGGFNFQVYHKIQLQKNGNTVDIRIDDIPAPTLSSISVNFDGAAQPELFTDSAQAAFDGVVYTIGWDEWNSRVQYWGGSKSGFPQVGTWNYVSTGINSTESDGAKYIFKGDFMEECEIDVRCSVLTSNGNADRRLGISPAFVDASNYLLAEIDPATTQLIVKGVTNGHEFAYSPVSINYNPTPGSWNIRAAKLKNKIIIFVNGKELLTANVSYAASQVALITENQDANFSTILVYETKDKSLPSPWQETDLGSVNYPGRADFTEDFITINASGLDFWDTSDSGHFVYQQISSNKEIIAKVETLDPASYWSKACVMIRENLSANSPMAYIGLSRMDGNNTNSAQFIWRTTTGGGTPVLAKDKYKIFPSYIKLTRIGNTFAGYWSADGEDWEFIGNTEIAMSQNYYIGLGVTAQNEDRFTGAVFSDVKVQDVSADAIAYWRFEEGANGVKHAADQDNFYLDFTANNNHLSSWASGSRPTAINDIPFSTVPQTGSPNTLAIDFAPDQDLGTFGAQTGGKMIETYMFDAGWTVELSFKLDSFKWQMLLGKDGRPDGGAAPPTLFIKASNPAGDKFIDIGFFDNRTNYVAASSTTPLELNKWYNLALTFNGGTAKLYIKEEADANYDLENSVTSANPASLGQWAENWAIGRGMWNGGAADYTDGKIDEVRISNAALAPAQFLAANYVPVANGSAWNVDADGDWQDSGNWLNGIIANGAENTAYFTNNISADRLISLKQNRIIGNITVSDPSGNNRFAIENGGGGTLTLDNGASTPIIDVSGDGLWALTVATPVEGINGFTKTGAKALPFWAANNIAGTVTISEGSIAAMVDGVLKNADVVVNNAAVFNFGSTWLKTLNPKSIFVENGGEIKATEAGTFTINCPLTLNGGDALSFENNGLNVTNNGTITLNASTRIFNWGNGGNIVMNGPVSGTGDLDMIGQSAAAAHTKTYFLNAQNSYSGNSFFSGFACSPTFEINGHQRLPNSGLTFRIHDWATEDTDLFVDMNSYTQRVTNLSIEPGNTGGDYIEIRGEANAEIGVSGNLTIGGPGLVKLAGGKISADGLATFNSWLTVENADFIANGSVAGSSGIEIGSGGNVGGSGNIGDTTVKSGGKLTPGNSIGTLNAGDVEMQSGSLYDWEFADTTLHEADLIDCAALTLQTTANSITVNVIKTTGVTMSDDTNSLFSATSISGNANSIFLNYSGSLGISGPANPIFDGTDVIITGLIPEPGIIGLLGLILLTFFRKNH